MAPSAGATVTYFKLLPSFSPQLASAKSDSRGRSWVIPKRGFWAAVFSLDLENSGNFVCPPLNLRVSRAGPLGTGSNLFLAGRDRDLRKRLF